MYDWTVKSVMGVTGSRKVIAQGDKEIVNVDPFTDWFINSIIEAHNKAVSEAMYDGAATAMEVVRDLARECKE